MKIALLCAGLGNIDRGHEVFARSVFDLLKNDLDITLFKGGGQNKDREVVLENIPRYSPLLADMRLNVSEKWKTSIMEEKREDVECSTFAYFALKPLLIGSYDIIHCLERRVAQIIWDHRYLFKNRPRFLFSNGGALARGRLPGCDFIQEYTEYNLKKGIKAKSFLIPHGVDLTVFDPTIKSDFRSRHNIPPSALTILSVGKICRWHKRMDYLVKEISKINGVYLVVVGQESPDSTAIKDLASNLMGERAIFLQMPHEELPQVYKSADIFVLASLSETFGIAYIEAMAMGIPVIASDNTNIRQILKNQVFINMKKEGELAKAIKNLGEEKRREISKNGRRVVEEYYDLAKLKSRYIEMYRKIYESQVKDKRYLFRDKIKNNICNLLNIKKD
ncbi:MAG: glycosyltransferase family 4 protein [Candidatus Omnitrophica bacterium]|nr:glycosyltransferase family 4 protein [Candidatus Omnitrophota bacterium]MCM8791345.1 glycosyltransferase family 4 protein [Candidatus Omnitrophota bacterium]